MKKKSVLGKGMGALLSANVGTPINNPPPAESIPAQPEQKAQIQDGPIGPATKSSKAQVPNGEIGEQGFVIIALENIKPNPNQPRKVFTPEDLESLKRSIAENGIIQPIVVTPIEDESGKYEIVAGERRYRAAKELKLEYVPTTIKKLTQRQKLILAIVENVQRADLNCVEEALGYFRLMEEFKLSQEEVAKRVGKERSSIANFLRLLKLPKDVIVYLQKEQMSFGHGKVLAGISNSDKASRLAKRVISEKLSIRELESLAKKNDSSSQASGVSNSDQYSYDKFETKLQRQTGLHLKIKTKKNGSGELLIKFSNEAEFEDIFARMVKLPQV